MHRHHYDLGAGFACLRDLARHFVAVDERYLYSVGRLYAVGAVGVVEKSYLYSVDVFDERYHAVALLRCGVGAYMVYSERIEGRERASRGPVSPVKTVVVGREHEVEACVAEGLGIAVGG